MKKLKNLKGVAILSKNEQKSLIGGGGPVACYCPDGTFASLDMAGEGCGGIIDHNCPLES